MTCSVNMLAMNVAHVKCLLVTCMQVTLVMRSWPGVLVLNPWLIRLGLLFAFAVGPAVMGAPLCSMFCTLSSCTTPTIRLWFIPFGTLVSVDESTLYSVALAYGGESVGTDAYDAVG